MQRLVSGAGAKLALAVFLVVATVTSAAAQGRQTGLIRGTTLDSQGLVLAGVTVTVRSDALQGERSVTSGVTGNYEIPGLPPGVYTITFELDGFADATETATVALGGAEEVNATMAPGQLAETIQVVAINPTPVASTETSANLTATDLNVIPVGRTLFRITELAPGLTNNTPNAGQVAINGSFAYDNVFLVDGVDINDNIFGTNHNLFIEDAVEEVQVLTSGVSAEYGRFSGGVINTITKSGGNRFSGSFRANLYKPDWTSRTPFEIENDQDRTGDLVDNTTYETTVGGPIVQDRLWFFYANRRQRVADDETFDETGFGYEETNNNDRNQIKFTGTVAPGHTLEGSYMRSTTEQSGPTFSFSIEPNTLRTRQLPNDLWVATYRGAATSNLFTEFQVSQKEFGFRNSGGTQTDIVNSPMITLTQALGHFNAPYFDATDPQDRNNRQITGSATYLLDTAAAGTHSIKGGFEHYRSTLTGGNSQSATGFVFDVDYAVDAAGTPLQDANGFLIPVFAPGASLIEDWRPIRGAQLDIDTLSLYVNDTWTAGSHLTFNLGVRAEVVDSDATGNIVGVDTSAVVPRLAASYDPMGDGRYTFQATYGHYAGKYNDAQVSQNTNVGTPDLLLGVYTGPAGQGRDFAPGFDSANYSTLTGIFPVQNVFFDDDLKSPLTKEFTLSGGTAIGNRSYAKVTYIHRTMSDFIEDFFTLDGGATTLTGDGQTFGTFTNQIFRNTDALERTYDGVQFQGRAQVTNSFVLDGSWTVQINNEGNFEGELTNQPALSSDAFDYPEITPADRFFPVGRLDDFQKHKVRLFGIYNLDLGPVGAVDVGAIWRYNSGQVYSLSASNVRVTAQQQAILDSLGYVDGPSPRTLYFSAGRGSETFDGYGLFDLSFQYSIPVWESLEPWIKVELFNVLNNDKVVSFNTSVTPNFDGPLDDQGLPTTFIEGSRFGEPTSPDDYPQYIPGQDGLRTFQFAMGIRF